MTVKCRSQEAPVSDSPDPLGLISIFLLSSGQLYGLEKFWAFLKYSKAKNLEIDPKLQEFLSKFKRLEDFRIDVSSIFLGVCKRWLVGIFDPETMPQIT